MTQHTFSARRIVATTLPGLLFAAPAIAADSTTKMTPSWPRATEVRQHWNSN